MPPRLPILVVDDSAAERRRMAALLTDLGYPSQAVADGPSALDRVRHESFELVTCDLNMPKMSGIEVLRLVRQIRPDLKVLMVTSSDAVRTAIEALRNGAIDYIVKPVDRHELQDAIGRATRGGAPILRKHGEIAELRREIAIRDAKLAETDASARALRDELDQLRRELSQNATEGLKVAVNLLRSRDPALADHCERVAGLAARFAGARGESEGRVLQIRAAAMLHDVGLLGLDPDLVRRVHAGAPIDEDEQRLYCRYCATGERLLDGVPRFEEAHTMLKELARVQLCMAGAGSPRLRIDWGASVIVASEAYDTAARLCPGHARLDTDEPWLPPALHGVFDRTLALGVRDFAVRACDLPDDMVAFLDGLRPGMVVERELRSPRGVLIASVGTVLSDDRIATIRRLMGEPQSYPL